MQIVIDIAKSKWETIQNGMYCGLLDGEMYQAIKNGTVLPENHGRLIDLDALCDEHLSGCYIELEEHEISEIPVIIERTEGKE